MESSTKNVDLDVRLVEVELNSILKGWRIDTLQNPLFCIFFLLFSSLGCVIFILLVILYTQLYLHTVVSQYYI